MTATISIGSFTASVFDTMTFSVPAILFGEFAVHSSLGRACDPKGREKDTRGKITVSHCPTGMSLDFFDDLMSAVFLAQELQNSVPPEIASSTDKNILHATLGIHYRKAVLAVVGRDVGREMFTRV